MSYRVSWNILAISRYSLKSRTLEKKSYSKFSKLVFVKPSQICLFARILSVHSNYPFCLYTVTVITLYRKRIQVYKIIFIKLQKSMYLLKFLSNRIITFIHLCFKVTFKKFRIPQCKRKK